VGGRDVTIDSVGSLYVSCLNPSSHQDQHSCLQILWEF